MISSKKADVNFKELAVKLFLKGIAAVKPQKLIGDCLSVEKNTLKIDGILGEHIELELNYFESIFVVGAGKASAALGEEIEKKMGGIISGGVIVTKYGFKKELKKIEVVEAGHPYPDESGSAAADKISSLCEKAGKNDLIINLLSGGASALLPMPAQGISLSEKAAVTNILMNAGSNIKDLNIVRKHLSQLKGGGLARICFPATVVSLIVSDVIGDDFGTIGSGITFPDSSTFADCLSVINKYGIREKLPSKIIEFIEEQTRKEGSLSASDTNNYFENVHNILIGNNKLALNAIRDEAAKMGFDSSIKKNDLCGQVKPAVNEIIRDVKQVLNSKLTRPVCLIYGGETEVFVTGGGKGGRNQQLCLEAALELQNLEGVTILSGGTDGNDGITDAAGAVCDCETVSRAVSLGHDPLKFLEANDSYNFFKPLNDLIFTGPTDTNVMDIQIALVNK